MKHFDLVIIGGGIAGLWTLAEARTQGLNAILFEQQQLGAGQTLCSQGIIHGGSKYALQAKVTKATSNISQMPELWLNAYHGNGPIDLQSAKLLAEKQYLIPSASIDGKLLSFFASKTMASHSTRVGIEDAPTAYQALNLKGSIFELNEPIFDTASILSSLAEPHKQAIYHAKISKQQLHDTEDGVEILLDGERIKARKLLITAGEGFDKINSTEQQMQTRPLHMVVAKSDKLPLIYAHFIGRSSKPLLTITSHPVADGVVWYLGGGLAEDGLELSDKEQQQKAQHLLAKLLPDFDYGELVMNSFFINRAEPKQQGLLRPDDVFVKAFDNIIIGWPTKLALAPRLASLVLKMMDGEKQAIVNSRQLDLPYPEIADYPWSGL